MRNHLGNILFATTWVTLAMSFPIAIFASDVNPEFKAWPAPQNLTDIWVSETEWRTASDINFGLITFCGYTTEDGTFLDPENKGKADILLVDEKRSGSWFGGCDFGFGSGVASEEGVKPFSEFSVLDTPFHDISDTQASDVALEVHRLLMAGDSVQVTVSPGEVSDIEQTFSLVAPEEYKDYIEGRTEFFQNSRSRLDRLNELAGAVERRNWFLTAVIALGAAAGIGALLAVLLKKSR